MRVASDTGTRQEAETAPGRDDGRQDEAVAVVGAGGDAYRITVRGHTLLVDQPIDAGGDDRGPTPTDLFVAALAGCVAFYAGRYLARHCVATDRLRVSAEYDMATDRPARIAAVRIRLAAPEDLAEQRRSALLAVATHCTVHNSFTDPPAVDIQLD
jgi:putative redox protein